MFTCVLFCVVVVFVVVCIVCVVVYCLCCCCCVLCWVSVLFCVFASLLFVLLLLLSCVLLFVCCADCFFMQTIRLARMQDVALFAEVDEEMPAARPMDTPTRVNICRHDAETHQCDMIEADEQVLVQLKEGCESLISSSVANTNLCEMIKVDKEMASSSNGNTDTKQRLSTRSSNGKKIHTHQNTCCKHKSMQTILKFMKMQLGQWKTGTKQYTRCNAKANTRCKTSQCNTY